MRIQEYIKQQLEEDKLGAQLSFDKSPYDKDRKKANVM
jgi:hypothetical protein